MNFAVNLRCMSVSWVLPNWFAHCFQKINRLKACWLAGVSRWIQAQWISWLGFLILRWSSLVITHARGSRCRRIGEGPWLVTEFWLQWVILPFLFVDGITLYIVIKLACGNCFENGSCQLSVMKLFLPALPVWKSVLSVSMDGILTGSWKTKTQNLNGNQMFHWCI
jgi:hypothetical protein